MARTGGKKDVQLGVRMPETLKQAVERAARKDKRRASAWTRLLLEESLEAGWSVREPPPADEDPLVRAFDQLDREDSGLVDAVLLIARSASGSVAERKLIQSFAAVLDGLAAARAARRTAARRKKSGGH